MSEPGVQDLEKIQGLVARNYDRMMHVCHFVLKVTNPAAAKRFIERLIPRVSTAIDTKANLSVNIGFTFQGLVALGLKQECAALERKTELQAFVQGAVERAELVGDVDENGPRAWKDGLGRTDRVDVVLSVYAEDELVLKKEGGSLLDAGLGAFELVSSNPGAELGNQGLIHFGYKDGISQPNIAGLPLRNSDDGQPQCPAGAFLLGYPSQFQNHTYDFDFPVALGRNGTFAVFRIMKQDVHGFENFLTQQAGPGGDRELVAAKICGRWRDGTPLVVSSERPENNPTNNFTFSKDPGKACPFSAHIRRTNPRDDRVAGLSGRKHRIVRAAMPYGPPYTGAEDGKERGLMGLFFCVNIADQFEFIMKNWVNRGGFQGSLSATDSDPLVGLHSFVRTRGSAYCFYPSLDGLRYIAQSA